MQQGDYTSSPYYNHQYPPHLQNPNPNPNPNPMDHQNYASAPPFSTSYGGDFPSYSQSYPPNADLLPPPPTAPSYSTTAPPPPTQPPMSNSTAPQSFSPYDSHGSYPASSSQQLHFSAWHDQPRTDPNYAPPSSDQQPHFSSWHDQPQTAPSYGPPPPPPPPLVTTMTPNPSSGLYSPAAYNPIGSSSVPSVYDASYDNNNSVKFDQGVGYFDGGYSRGEKFDYGSDLYGKRADDDSGYGDGVYAYEGGKMEPYGARGTASKSSTWAMFDDYGRAISFGKDSSSGGGSGSSRIVKAVPKVEAQQDVKSGVQKFRVKLLAESGGQSTMDVLCQVIDDTLLNP